MAAIELRSIDLAVEYNDGPGATLVFRIHPEEAKAHVDLFEVSITVPRMGNYNDAVDRGFRALHRLAQDLDQTLQSPAAP